MHLGLILAALVFLSLTVWLWSRQPVVAFRPWLDWWSKFDPQKKYRCVPLTLMAYYYGPRIFFLFAKAFAGHRQGAAQDWYFDFLMSVLRSQARDVVKVPEAILTPRHICQSLVPGDDDPKDAAAMVKAVQIGSSGVQVGDDFLYPSEPLMQKWPTNLNDWRILMCADVELGGWGIQFSTKDPKNQTWDAGNHDRWSSAPTNFLWRYSAVPNDSLLVIGFLTQGFSWAKAPTYPAAMNPLLGIADLEGGVGGWWGLLTAGQRWGGYSALSLQNYIFSSALQPRAAGTSPCKEPYQLVASGLSMAAMAVPLFWETGPVAVAIAAATAGGLGFGLGAAAQGCSY